MTFNDGKDLIIEYFCLQVVYKSVVIKSELSKLGIRTRIV